MLAKLNIGREDKYLKDPSSPNCVKNPRFKSPQNLFFICIVLMQYIIHIKI